MRCDAMIVMYLSDLFQSGLEVGCDGIIPVTSKPQIRTYPDGICVCCVLRV